MLRPILVAIPLALVAALPSTAASAKPSSSKQRAAQISTRAPGPALPVIVQDDAQLIWHEEAPVRAAMAQLKHLGVEWVRLTASWSELTRDPFTRARPAFDATNPGDYVQDQWKSLDQAVRFAHEAGLKIMMDIGFWAPLWATSDLSGNRPRTDINDQEFRAFAVAVVRRYGGGFVVPDQSGQQQAQASAARPDPPIGILPPDEPSTPPAEEPAPAPAAAPLPKVSTFMLWNEPNHPAFLKPQWRKVGKKAVPVSPHLYRQMVVAAYPAIKAVRGDARVLIGNVSSTGGQGNGAVPPLQFLRALACVNRHLQPVKVGECGGYTRLPGDGWAQHPYQLDTSPDVPAEGRDRDDVHLADLPRLSKILDRLVKMGRLSPKLRSIYITEFGYETQPIKGRPNLSEGDQARYLAWSDYIASRVPAVKMFGQFLLRDVPPAAVAQSGSPRRAFGQFSTGLLHSDGSWKLSYRSFRAGLYVQRISDRTVMLWGHLRLGPGKRRLAFEHQVAPRKWVALASSPGPKDKARLEFIVPGDRTFVRFARVRKDSRYRLDYVDGADWMKGLPVAAVDKRPWH
jgi:hypothetical protein